MLEAVEVVEAEGAAVQEEEMAAEPAAPPIRSGRKRKARAVFGDNGEMDGPSSSFRSTPAARKASVDPSEEMGVPARPAKI